MNETAYRGSIGDFFPYSAHLHGGAEGECCGHYEQCPPALN